MFTTKISIFTTSKKLFSQQIPTFGKKVPFITPTREKILTHIFFVSLFLIIPSVAFVRPPDEPFMAFTRIYVQDTTANFVLLCFFYINYYVFLPKLFFTKKYIIYIVCIIVFLSLAFMLPLFMGKFFADAVPNGAHLFNNNQQFNHGSNFRPPIMQSHSSIGSFVFDEFRRHLSLFFTAIFFSFLLKTRENLARVTEEKLSAELNSLKAQINPHFLFNTLNTIYSLSIKKDDKASDAIINLSGLMRYVIKDAQENKILLQKELDYIHNYIELQKARLGNTTTINFSSSGFAEHKKIVPLLLISFIENAFKYGVNPDAEECIVNLSIQITHEGLYMNVYNKKVPFINNIVSTGIGLNNTIERLQKLYPNKHKINIINTETDYTTTLEIILV